MNKFVKGAKNLAFALSFVTVCACNNVSKDEFDALKFDIKYKEIKVNGEIDEAKRKVNEMFEVAEKEVDKKLDEMRNEVVSKKNFSGWFLRELIVSLGNDRVKTFLKMLLGRNPKEKIFTGDVFKVSVDNKKIVIKRNGEVIYENFEVSEIEDLDFIVNVILNGGYFEFDTSFKEDNRIKFGKGSGFGKISVGKFTTSGLEESRNVISKLGYFKKEFFECFFDRNLTVLASEDGKIGGCDFKGYVDFNGKDDFKKLFGDGLINLFGQEGEFTEKEFVFKEAVNGKLKKIALLH